MPVAARPADATDGVPRVGTPTSPDERSPRNYGLDLLRVVAICGVVAIHIFGVIVAKDDLRGNLGWWIATAVDIGAIWSVPVFIMISGTLALDPAAHRAGPYRFYRKRFARILPAMIAWHLIYLVLVRVMLRGEDITPVGLGRMLLDSKVFTGLYFLWLIAGLYVLAPVLAAFLKDGGPRRAWTTAGVALGWTLVAYMLPGLALLAGDSRPNTLTSWNRWWPYVGFFLAGWALRKVVLSRPRTVLALVVAAALLAEGVWQFGVAPAHRLVQAVFPVMATGTLMAVAAVLIYVAGVSAGGRLNPSPRGAAALVRLSEVSFGVFLVHLLVFELIRLSVPSVAAGRSLVVMAATYAVVLVTSFAVSLGAARIPYVRAIF